MEPAAPIELTSTRGRVTVFLRAVRAGDDLVVTIGGGDRPHIGAVAVSQPREFTATPFASSAPAHSEPGGNPFASSVGRASARSRDATTSVITLPGHREDELARRTAARIATELGVAACVACGIHVDRITPSEIQDVEALVAELTDGLLRQLASV